MRISGNKPNFIIIFSVKKLNNLPGIGLELSTKIGTASLQPTEEEFRNKFCETS